MCREFISKWVSSVPAAQSFFLRLLTGIDHAMQHETVCDISDETVGYSNWCVFQDLTVQNCRLLLDLDVTARPVWNRRLAEEWRASSSCAIAPLRMLTPAVTVYYQEQVAKRVKSSIHRLSEPNGHLFLRRPFQISWFTGQVAMCVAFQLSLLLPPGVTISHLPSLTDAWTCGSATRRSFARWSLLNPFSCRSKCSMRCGRVRVRSRCAGHSPSTDAVFLAAYRSQCDDLRSQLHKACAMAGIPSPLAPEFLLPPALLRV